MLPNFINSENERTEEIQFPSLINQLLNSNPISYLEAIQWAAEADDSSAQSEVMSDDGIIRTVTAEDDDDKDDDNTPANSVKISHSEAVGALNTSLKWPEKQNFEAHAILLFRHFRDRALHVKLKSEVQKKITDFFH